MRNIRNDGFHKRFGIELLNRIMYRCAQNIEMITEDGGDKNFILKIASRTDSRFGMRMRRILGHARRKEGNGLFLIGDFVQWMMQ